MNLLRKKSNSQLLHWEPFATSTPLKPFSVNQKSKNAICPVRPTNFLFDSNQSKLDVPKIFQNNQSAKSKIKITGRNRSRAYFDLSSSSDDSDDERVKTNRPVIKINKGSNEKVKLFPINGRCNNGVTEIKNNSNRSNTANSQVPENKAENKSASSNSDLENVGPNIPGSDNNLKNTKSTKSSNNKREEKLGNKQTRKKSVLIANNDNITKKLVKNSLKRKDTENKAANVVKKRKHVEADLTENQQTPKKSPKLKNCSHQLFTDTTQEELINTLCLTTPEPDELVLNLSNGDLKSNAEVGKKQSKITETISDEKQRPKRTRQVPKKFWVVENRPEDLGKKIKTSRIHRKKEATSCKTVSSQMDPPLVAEKITEKENLNEENKEIIVKKEQEEKPETCGQSDPQQEVVATVEPSKAEVPISESSTDYPNFLPLNKVPFIKNEFGNEVGQFYSLRNFKCGILKLKPGMVFKREKSQKNIYKGGVVIKGEIKMKIGGKESTVKEGDMAFVPPLTEWQATNAGQCESLFYYWCGKFSK